MYDRKEWEKITNYGGVTTYQELFNPSYTGNESYDSMSVLNAGGIFSPDLEEKIEEEGANLLDIYKKVYECAEVIEKTPQKKLTK